MPTTLLTDVDGDDLENRLRVLLPKQYVDRDDEIQPISMGSAALKYDPDGRVAWDEIWGSFCDLAMAGGPPHRGTVLEPASEQEIESETERYRDVVEEVCRGVTLVTGLFAEPSRTPGWVQMYCTSAGMAGWLARALVTENISATFQGLVLYLPAGPRYRVEKEIKNVITAIAKTCHYWLCHNSVDQHWEISRLFAEMENMSPLLQPPFFEHDRYSGWQKVLGGKIAESVQRLTGLRSSSTEYPGWFGLDCGSVRSAVWVMRTLVVTNVLSRREGTQVFIPVNSVSDPEGDRAIRALVAVHSFGVEKEIF